MGRSPSSPKIHQKFIYIWNNSYRIPLKCWQKTPDFPKASQSPLNEIEKKILKREKEFQVRDLCPREEDMNQEKFAHTWKLPHRSGQEGTSKLPRGVLWWVLRRQKVENSPQRSLLNSTFQPKVALTLTPTAESGCGMLRLRLGCQTQGENQGWLQ